MEEINTSVDIRAINEKIEKESAFVSSMFCSSNGICSNLAGKDYEQEDCSFN